MTAEITTATVTLTNLTSFPPKGYLYFEPKLNWHNPEPMQGLEHAVRLLQTVRAQNPASHLSPLYEDCKEAIKLYTCARLKYDSRWCSPPEPVVRTLQATQAGPRRCRTCGRRK